MSDSHGIQLIKKCTFVLFSRNNDKGENNMLVLSESVFPVTQARGLSPHQRSNSSCSSTASASYSESSASEGESAREHEKESAGRALSDRGRGKPVSSLTNQLARPTAAYTRKERASDRPLKQLTIEQTLPVFEDYLFDMDRSDASENEEEAKSKGPSTSSSAATAAKENAGKHPAKSKRSLATSQPAEKKDVEIAGSVESTLNRDALLLLIQKLSAGGIPQTKKPAPPRKATGTAAAKKPATRKRPAPTKAAAPARGKQTRRAASSSSSSSSSSSDSTGTSESSGDSSDSGSSDWQSAGNRQEGRSKKRGGDKKSEKKIKDNDVMAAQKKRKTKSSSHKKKSGRAGGKRKGLSTKERVNLRRMIAKAFGRRK